MINWKEECDKRFKTFYESDTYDFFKWLIAPLPIWENIIENNIKYDDRENKNNELTPLAVIREILELKNHCNTMYNLGIFNDNINKYLKQYILNKYNLHVDIEVDTMSKDPIRIFIPTSDELGEHMMEASLLMKSISTGTKISFNEYTKDEVLIREPRENEKHIIIINGKGGSGKDFLIQGMTNYYGENKIHNVSSIDPIKEVAKTLGWNGDKDVKSRKFLSDLKRLSINYNDRIYRYLLLKVSVFMVSSANFMFVHIREPEEIDKYISKVKSAYCGVGNLNIHTLLVTRPESSIEFGNSSDDGVDKFEYGLTYSNNKSKEEAQEDFIKFISEYVIIKDKDEG